MYWTSTNYEARRLNNVTISYSYRLRDKRVNAIYSMPFEQYDEVDNKVQDKLDEARKMASKPGYIFEMKIIMGDDKSGD